MFESRLGNAEIQDLCGERRTVYLHYTKFSAFDDPPPIAAISFREKKFEEMSAEAEAARELLSLLGEGETQAEQSRGNQQPAQQHVKPQIKRRHSGGDVASKNGCQGGEKNGMGCESAHKRSSGSPRK